MKRIYLILAVAAFLTGGKLLADGTNADFTKPAWLTDCSLGIKESYDNNVFLSGVSPQFLPANYTVPAGSVAALKDRWSWITAVSPKIGVNFAPLIGVTNVPVLSLAYAPDLVAYHEQPTENYTAHRVLAAAKIKTEPLTFVRTIILFSLTATAWGRFILAHCIAPSLARRTANAAGKSRTARM